MAEWRSTITSNKIELISKEWIGLKQAVNVIRVIYEKGIYRTEQAYFISSSNENAVFYAAGVRGYWAVENGLHWVKRFNAQRRRFPNKKRRCTKEYINN